MFAAAEEASITRENHHKARFGEVRKEISSMQEATGIKLDFDPSDDLELEEHLTANYRIMFGFSEDREAVNLYDFLEHTNAVRMICNPKLIAAITDGMDESQRIDAIGVIAEGKFGEQALYEYPRTIRLLGDKTGDDRYQGISSICSAGEGLKGPARGHG